MDRMAQITTDIGSVLNRAARLVMAFRPLSETLRDRLTRWAANRAATKMDRRTVKFAAVLTDYEAAANRLVTNQDAFLRFALKQNQDPLEVQQLRTVLTGFRDGFRVARTNQVEFRRVFIESDHATGKLIQASQRLGDVMTRSIAVSDQLDEHATKVLELIDAKLSS
jgi:hypothetical protein